MNQAATLKKKVPNPNKAQSPLKNMNSDIQYRSSTELANQYKIKREQLAKEHNDKTRKEQAPMAHKRKNTEEPIPQQGKNKFPGQKSMIQSSSREQINTSHMITGKVQNKKKLFQSQSGESIQKKGVELPMHNFMFQASSKVDVNTSRIIGRAQGEEKKQHAIQELQNCNQVKRKPVLPSTSLDQFLEKQGIHVGGEKQNDIHTTDDVRFTPASFVDEQNKGFNDLEEEEEIGEDECARDEDVDIDCDTNGISEKKKVRGQTTCKKIHTRNLDEREEVIFEKGQAVGPTSKILSDLSSFIGTVAWNSRFISLMYTSWRAVPTEDKKRMWDYVNSKFLIPTEGERWVMDGLRDAWRQRKRAIKKRCFNRKLTDEEMLAKRPDDMPEVQLRQLIKYWKHPTVQAQSEVNSQNRKKQKWRHRMGPISFARVRVALRATKENKEEPSKSEMFVATRTKTGKEVQADSQIAITELQNRQNSGETTDDAFRAVFGKEQPGRIRCYGRSVTKSSLKRDEETNKLKQKHANEVTSLKEEMREMREEMRHFFTQLMQNNPGLNVQDMPGCAGSNLPSPVDASSAQAVRGQNLPNSSGSTHASVLGKEHVGDQI